MIKPSFVVTVSVSGVSHRSVWNSEQPFKIGHPFRWMLEKTESGVRVRHIDGEHLDGRGAPRGVKVRDLSESEIVSAASGLDFNLPQMDGEKEKPSAFTVNIRPVVALPPAYRTHEGERGELRIYRCHGDWTKDSASLDKVGEPYTGTLQGQRVFTIRKGADQQYLVKSHVDELTLDKIRFKRGEELPLDARQLIGATLSLGELRWRVDTLKRIESLAAERERQALLAEDVSFRKSLQYAFGAVALFALMAFFWPNPPEEAKLPAQTTKLVFKHPLMGKLAAAPHGSAMDRSSGDTPHSRGSQRSKARSHRAQAAGTVAQAHPKRAHSEPAHKALAHAAPKKKAAPAAKVAVKKTPAKPVAVAHAPAHVAKPRHVEVAASMPHKHATRATHSEQSTEMAHVFNDQAFKTLSKGLVNGGMTQLISQSRFSKGSDARAEAKGLLSSHPSLGDSGISGGGGPQARDVSVAELGGGGGSGGGAGSGSGVGYGKGSHASVGGQGRSFVSLDSGASDVDEGLTREQVGRVIYSHMSEIRYCYEAAQLRSPDVEGKLAVSFVVGAPGSVKRAGVAESSLGDSKLNECILKRLVTWHFPHPKGGVNVAVSYPFIFKTLGR